MKNNNSARRDGEIRIIEEGIRPDIFSEFFNYLEDESSLVKIESDPRIEYVRLAKDGSIESFRKIERSIELGNLSGEIRDFALAALNYCRFKIENDLLDVSMDMISGGLGGTDNKMRIYVAVAGKEEITEGMFKFIKEAFEKSVKVRDSVLEEATNHGFYVSLVILLSFDYAYGDLIEAGISHCEFLQNDYYATNVEIPDDSRIRDWLDGKLDNDEYCQKPKT
jgi:acylphosphatase